MTQNITLRHKHRHNVSLASPITGKSMGWTIPNSRTLGDSNQIDKRANKSGAKWARRAISRLNDHKGSKVQLCVLPQESQKG